MNFKLNITYGTSGLSCAKCYSWKETLKTSGSLNGHVIFFCLASILMFGLQVVDLVKRKIHISGSGERSRASRN